MQLSGITEDGRSVRKGCFKLVGTHGMPLEIVLNHAKQSNWVVDWMDYITHALKDGHNPDTIRARILAAVGDVYGAKYKNEITIRLKMLFGNEEND